MALVKLRTLQQVLDFRETFNGKPFAAMLDDEICRVVRVRSIEVSSNEAPTFALPYGGSLGGPSTSSGVVELPLCPVCLERLDANASGLVTIYCQHTFRWTNSNCPVCRWSQDKLRSGNEPSVPSTCADCSAASSLWMCLICGHVGCGRYQDRHAWSHYVESTHSYAMELETSRIWDYAGDQYVHRLIQDKTDGKLVELPSLPAAEAGPSSLASFTPDDSFDSPAPTGGPNAAAALAQEKIEAIGVEYSHLLTAQLDSQRAYYVSKLATLKDESASLDRERDRLAKRADKALELSRKLQRELEAERSVSRGLLANLDRRKAGESAAEVEARRLRDELAEAQEQVRDLMFALDAQAKLESLGAGGGDIAIPEPAPSPSPARRKKR